MLRQSTYARTLHPGQQFFGPGSFPTIHTVYKVVPRKDKIGVKVILTTGAHIFYGDTERVQLVR